MKSTMMTYQLLGGTGVQLASGLVAGFCAGFCAGFLLYSSPWSLWDWFTGLFLQLDLNEHHFTIDTISKLTTRVHIF